MMFDNLTENLLYIYMRSTEKIVIHHIGGRCGNRPFPIIDRFEKDIINVLYDADKDCLEQIQQNTSSLECKNLIFPYCIGEKNGSIDFFVYKEPAWSSYLPFNPEYFGYYNASKLYDIPVSEASQFHKKVLLDLHSLDSLVRALKVPPPDILTVDAQGADYDVLMGAQENLQNNVLAVIVEAQFFELYKGQKIFSSILDYMIQCGFDFAAFTDFGGWYTYQTPIDFRGEHFSNEGNALFIKKISAINDKDKYSYAVKLKKLAYISTVFNYLNIAYECVTRSQGLAENNRDDKPVYMTFADDFYLAIKNSDKKMRPTISAFYPDSEAICDRYKASNPAKASSFFDRLKAYVKFRFPRLTAGMWNTLKAVQAERYRFPCRLTTSPVEKVLINYGLKEQCRKAKKNRIRASTFSS